MSIATLTLGRVFDSWKSLDEWIPVYTDIIKQRDYKSSTLNNKTVCINHIRKLIGPTRIGSIKPRDITTAIRTFLPDRASTAGRVLDEFRDMFNEAIQDGWIDNNPAINVRRPACKIKRLRLTLDQWSGMREIAQAGKIKWLEPLLLLALVTGQRRSDLVKMKFSDVWDDHLHIEQQKKAGKVRGAMVALPLSLHLDVIGLSLGDVIEMCRHYAPAGDYMLRKKNGSPFTTPDMLSYRFEECMNTLGAKLGTVWGDGERPSVHECRSLAEREYRKQGIDTQTLLGHKHQSMTDKYNDDRGLSAGDWKPLKV